MPGPDDNQVSPEPPLPPPPSGNPDVESGPPPQPPPRQQRGGCCKDRSLLEKCLFVLLLIVFLLFVAFLFGFVLLYYWKSEPQDICTNESCIKAATRMSEFLDRSAQPCEDFYQYACGNWLASSLIPEGMSEVNIYTDMKSNVKATLRKTLEEESNPTDTSAVQKTREFYLSCLDEEKIEEAGMDPFNTLIEQVGVWPSLDKNWNETDFILEEVLLSLSKTGSTPLIGAKISADADDSTVHRIHVGRGSLGLGTENRDHYLKGLSSRKLRAYHTMLQQLFEELGLQPAEAERDATEVVELEIQIANISIATEDRKDKAKYVATSIEDLEKRHPQFDWGNYINGLLQYGDAPPQVTRTEKIINISPGFFEKLFPILEKTPKRVLANYLMSSLRHHTSHLNQRFRQMWVDYHKEVSGIKSPLTRWEYCVELTERLFPEPTSRIFVEKTLSKKDKEYLENLISALQGTFVDIVREAEWLSFAGKTAAMEKARALKARVGYSSDVMDNSFLESKYTEYNMSRDFFENNLRVVYLQNLANVVKLRQPAQVNKFFPATSIRAFYDHQSNEIVIPAGVVQSPIFEGIYPRSMNYGGIGSFIGREISHVFGEIGHLVDKNGNKQTWWTALDTGNFEKRAECMVDQYSCFRWKPTKMNIDGLRTLKENIADNTGLKQSYRAYRFWVEQHGMEEKFLPGLNLTHNQLFFLSYAQLWCSSELDVAKIEKVKSDLFAPGPFRVVGALQNSEDFATAFKCAQGSRMNPEKKCKVW